MREPGKFCRNLQEEESSAGPAGQDERNAPDGATNCGGALSGHGHSGVRHEPVAAKSASERGETARVDVDSICGGGGDSEVRVHDGSVEVSKRLSGSARHEGEERVGRCSLARISQRISRAGPVAANGLRSRGGGGRIMARHAEESEISSRSSGAAAIRCSESA